MAENYYEDDDDDYYYYYYRYDNYISIIALHTPQ